MAVSVRWTWEMRRRKLTIPPCLDVREKQRDVGESNQWGEDSLEIHEAALRRANSESRRLSLR